MESRWLAFVSLILLLNISLPVPGYPAALRAKNSIKASHAAAKKPTANKSLAKSNTSRSKGHRIAAKPKSKKSRLASRRSLSRQLTRRPAVTSAWTAPVTTAYSAALSSRINASFKRGGAAIYSPQDLVRARVFVSYPMRGGIRNRSEGIRYLVLHSTETGRPADARTIVRSWSNIGARHPGTQYLVDRDGTIIQTVDPYYATVHVNAYTALRGVNNDNSIGIEIVRTGSQKYTQKQLDSLVALVAYVKDRFNITQVYGHGQIQPSDRTDPVAFDWNRLSRNLALIRRGDSGTATAYHRTGNTNG